MKILPLLLLCCVMAAGCAGIEVYDPMHAAQNQVLLLNESALKSVKVGMSEDEVHTLAGQALVIGYSARSNSPGYEPLTIPNPYKIEKLNVGSAAYVVEYYVSMVRHPDGTISNDELEPLVFKDGKLAGKGWDYLKRLHPRP